MISLTRSASPRRTAPLLYASLVAAARQPALYKDFLVPDTIEGRYEMIALHAALLLRRIGAEGRALAPLGQAVLDYMAADLDRSMRELGVGDLSVGKFMKRLGEGFYGRAAAYGAALEHTDGNTLREPLLRNAYDGQEPGDLILDAFADYVRKLADHLADQPIERIAAGEVDFLALAPVAL